MLASLWRKAFLWVDVILLEIGKLIDVFDWLDETNVCSSKRFVMEVVICVVI